MEPNPDQAVVINNEQAQRFETTVGALRALITYRRSADRLTLLHAEVPPPLQRRGLAAKLARTALDFARTNHLEVVPLCPYVSTFIRKHREYQDLVSAEQLKKILSP